MALDSRSKRFSMMSFGKGFSFIPMFEADGAIDADDRAHLLNLYGGIALDIPIVVASLRDRTMTGVGL